AAKHPKVPLQLTARVDGDAVVVRVRTTTAPTQGQQLWAALAEDGLSSEVKRGENLGRTLSHTAGVRAPATLAAPEPPGGGVGPEGGGRGVGVGGPAEALVRLEAGEAARGGGAPGAERTHQRRGGSEAGHSVNERQPARSGRGPRARAGRSCAPDLPGLAH